MAAAVLGKAMRLTLAPPPHCCQGSQFSPALVPRLAQGLGEGNSNAYLQACGCWGLLWLLDKARCPEGTARNRGTLAMAPSALGPPWPASDMPLTVLVLGRGSPIREIQGVGGLIGTQVILP